jgi:polysaccharide export outer membrane protein
MRLIRDAARKYAALLAIAIIVPFLGGCSIFGSDSDSHAAPVGAGETASRVDPLLPGDGVTIDFSGTPIPLPSIHTEIKGDGTVRLDFIGDVQAAGKTPGELERAIQTRYVPDYYTHLNVTVTPSGRFFYIEGEVSVPGRFPYAGPITVTRAITAAGGFNPFADRKHVKLYRANATTSIKINCVKALDDPKLDLPVYPGDKVFVPRRLY